MPSHGEREGGGKGQGWGEPKRQTAPTTAGEPPQESQGPVRGTVFLAASLQDLPHRTCLSWELLASVKRSWWRLGNRAQGPGPGGQSAFLSAVERT